MMAGSPAWGVAAGSRRKPVIGYATAAGTAGESVCSISCCAASRWLPNSIQNPRGGGEAKQGSGAGVVRIPAVERRCTVNGPHEEVGAAALALGLLVGVRVDERRPQHANPLRLDLQHGAARRGVYRLVADTVPAGGAQGDDGARQQRELVGEPFHGLLHPDDVGARMGPVTQQPILPRQEHTRSCGSPTSSGVAIHGPTGPQPSVALSPIWSVLEMRVGASGASSEYTLL